MRLLIVEDDRGIAEALRSALDSQGIIVDLAVSLAQARAAVRAAAFGLVVVDWNLPDGEGVSFVRELRADGLACPVLMLTARDSTVDKVAALDAGADDYITKPFDIDELLARLRALARRPSEARLPTLHLGALEFDFTSRQASVNGIPLDLPKKQVLVLEALCLRAGRTVSRDSLTNAVYGFDELIGSNTLESHISRLRKALAEAGVQIHTLRGLGYVIKAE